MLRQYELLEKAQSYDPNLDEELLNKAYMFSMQAHYNQVRQSGDYYFSHPVQVASILCDFRLDQATIITGLLHDTVEDTLTTHEEIEGLFGHEIAHLVEGVTKLSKLHFKSQQAKEAENFKKLVLAMSSDIRVLLVKIVDRLHNMRTLHHVKSQEKRQRIAKETLDIYVPLTDRIGIFKIKDEMENLAFSFLYPDVYDSIRKRIHNTHKDSKSNIYAIIEELRRHLGAYSENVLISGRLKSPYSIWQKMQRKNMSLEQLFDIMAFRVIVDTIPECYRILGVIHSYFPFIPGFFRDYISTPKPNKYQSIHTCVMGPFHQRIEIQIRTHDMHYVNEFGVAAHWHYKERQDKGLETQHYSWLRGLLEVIEHANCPQEFLEHTRMEMFSDEVFCFSPKGQIISLSKGSTSIDFAYAIHSHMGDHAVGCRINGQIVPLDRSIENGDIVEVDIDLTKPPSPDWLSFVVTGRAKSCIRRFIRNSKKEEFIKLGHAILTQECKNKDVLFCYNSFQKSSVRCGYKTFDDVLIAIANGSLKCYDFIKRTYVLKEVFDTKESTAPCSAIPINGLSQGISVHYAKCCHPLPGDQIVGVIMSKKGVRLHTRDCETLSYVSDSSRLLNLRWEDDASLSTTFVTRFKIIFHNQKGALSSITTALTHLDSNIINIKVMERSVEFWTILLDVEIKGVNHLEHILAALHSVSCVNFVERVQKLF